MFIKPLTIPRHILEAISLDRRISADHPLKETFSKQARNLLSGYKGEKSMQYHLQYLPEDDFHIFYYIRLPDSYGCFQMDFLLLSRWFYLIIEVKSVFGNMHFDDLGQAYRTTNEEAEVFRNPIEQVNLQHKRFLEWLKKHGFPNAPIEKIVVYSRDDTILRNLTNDPLISKFVMHRDKVIPKIEAFMKEHQKPHISEQHLIDISHRLLTEHTPEKIALDNLDISYTDLIRGVVCQQCQVTPMLWKNGNWCCSSCGCKSKTAHRPALLDYALLVGPTISNRQARHFLQLKSASVARKILQREYLPQVGKGSGMRYKLDIHRFIDE